MAGQTARYAHNACQTDLVSAGRSHTCRLQPRTHCRATKTLSTQRCSQQQDAIAHGQVSSSSLGGDTQGAVDALEQRRRSNGSASTSSAPSPHLQSSSHASANMPAGHMMTRIITAKITRSQSLADLEHILWNYEGQLDAIHTSALLMRLSRLAQPLPPQSAQQYPQHAQQLQRQSTQQQGQQSQRAPQHDAQQQGQHSGQQQQPVSSKQQQHQQQKERPIQHNQQLMLPCEQPPNAEQLGPEQPQQQQLDAVQAKALMLARQHVAVCAPQQLSNVLYAMAKLGIASEPRLAAHLLRRCAAQAGAFTPQGLSNVLYACALLDLQPGTAWFKAWCGQCRARLVDFNSQDLANTVWALARLSHRPSIGWAADFAAEFEAKLDSFKAQELVNTVWALAALRRPPPSSCLCRVVTHFRPARLSQLQPQQLANLLWALARCRHQPSAPWLANFEAAAERLQGSFTPQGLSTLLWALSELRQQPGPPSEAWLGWLQERLLAAPALAPQDIAMALVAVGKLRRAAPHFAESCLERALPQLQGFSARELAHVAWALARLKHKPQPAAVAALLRAAHARVHEFQPNEIAALLWALATLQIMPDLNWLADMLSEASERLPSFRPQSLSNMLWALGVLGIKPNKEWMGDVLQAARRMMRRFDGQDLVGVIEGVARMRYRPGQRWLVAFAAQVDEKLGIVPPHSLQRIAASLRSLGYTGSHPWLSIGI